MLLLIYMQKMEEIGITIFMLLTIISNKIKIKNYSQTSN